MRHFAMTGIVTASWISRILCGSAMRGDPALGAKIRGTRSSAITAHAPGVLGDPRLFRVDDVHDDAALEHLRKSCLDPHRAGHGAA